MPTREKFLTQPETKEEKRPGAEKETQEQQLKKVDLIDIDGIEGLLNKVEESFMTSKELYGLIDKKKEAEERVKTIERIFKERLDKVKNFNPLGELSLSDYDSLEEDGFISGKEKEVYKKMEEARIKLEEAEAPTGQQANILMEINEAQEKINQALEAQIKLKQEEINSRKEEVESKVLEHYTQRVKNLEKIIDDINQNPNIEAREKELIEKEKKEAQEALEKIEKEINEQASRYIQSLESRHENSFKKINDLLKDEIYKKLEAVFLDKNSKNKQSLLDSTRDRLINCVINGEGENQLKEPREVVPWKVSTSKVNYINALHFLRGRENKKHFSDNLLQRADQLLFENDIFRAIYGPESKIDKKTGERLMGVFWASFDERQKNDEEGITEQRKKLQEERVEKENENKDLLSQGYIKVEIPIYAKNRGKRFFKGSKDGFVKIELTESKKGTPCYEVVGVAGAAEGHIKIGFKSAEWSSFPKWITEAVLCKNEKK